MKPLNDRELKDATVRDYTRNARRMGLQPDLESIEALVVHDLTLVDRYEADQASKPKKKPAKKERDIRTDELQEQLDEHGMRAYVNENPKDRPGDAIADATPKSEKAIAMFARIKEILRPRGSIAAAANQGKTLEESLIECQAPVLAREFLELWTWYVPLRALWSPKNPFYWLSDGDAAKKFIRGLEDICDRSTGQFGHWWVK